MAAGGASGQAKGAAASARARSSTTERLNGGGSAARTDRGRADQRQHRRAGEEGATAHHAPIPAAGTGPRRLQPPADDCRFFHRAPKARHCDNNISPRFLQGTRCALHLLAEVESRHFQPTAPCEAGGRDCGRRFSSDATLRGSKPHGTRNSPDPAIRPSPGVARGKSYEAVAIGAHRPDAPTVSPGALTRPGRRG